MIQIGRIAALHLLAMRPTSPATSQRFARVLIEKGADLRAKDSSHKTAMHYAAAGDYTISYPSYPLPLGISYLSYTLTDLLTHSLRLSIHYYTRVSGENMGMLRVLVEAAAQRADVIEARQVSTYTPPPPIV